MIDHADELYKFAQPAFPSIFPDNPSPVIRIVQGKRELVLMRWGMPSPPQFGPPGTNIRNTKSPQETQKSPSSAKLSGQFDRNNRTGRSPAALSGLFAPAE